MAHFSKLDENNVVEQVIVISNDEILDSNGNESEELGIALCKNLFGEDTEWKQTSYNNNFRVHFGSVGYTYNEEFDAFIPPKLYPSWVLNTETFLWDPPVPRPILTEEEDPIYYTDWDEENLRWNIERIPRNEL